MDYTPLWISVKTALAATLATFMIGLYAAWKMARFKGKTKGIIDRLLTLPMVLPPTVAGFFLLLLFGKNGPLGRLLALIDIKVIFSWTATVIAAVAVSFPLMYKTTKSAIEQVDENIISAARTLGATELRIFWRIVVPLAWPGIAAGTALAFTRAIGEFGATLMIAGNIPGRTQTIPMAIFFAAEGGQMERALIWVFLILILSFSVMMLMNYWNTCQAKHVPALRGGKA